MNESQFFKQGSRGCFMSILVLLIVIFAMVLSTTYQYPAHPACGGMLGAGFPVLFICDDWGGGSPTSSWGKITYIDVPNGGIRPTGFFIDLVFYTVLVWIVLLIFQKRLNDKGLWWAAFISIGFLVGFACAFLTFQSSSLYRGDHFYYASPTPVIPSPTALGTLPSEVTPVDTPTP